MRMLPAKKSSSMQSRRDAIRGGGSEGGRLFSVIEWVVLSTNQDKKGSIYTKSVSDESEMQTQ